MRAFEVFSAKDSQHAVALMAQHAATSKVKVLAGGTDLLADLKFAPSSHAPAVVVDISRVDDFRGIKKTKEGLSIGALVTHTEIMRSPLIQDMFPALVDAAHTIGAVQTRNLGTLGGNLVTAVPSVDSGPTLVALDAVVTIVGPGGKRHMSLAEFFVGPRKTALKSDELLAEIIIPTENLAKPTHFLKFGLRKGQALALVNVASSIWIDWDKNTFKAPRGCPESDPRDERGELSRRTPDYARGDGRGGQTRRRRRQADYRYARLGGIPERPHSGADKTNS
jgi:CO/xanthine dehydrogenase FAD-binding subunit